MTCYIAKFTVRHGEYTEPVIVIFDTERDPADFLSRFVPTWYPDPDDDSGDDVTSFGGGAVSIPHTFRHKPIDETTFADLKPIVFEATLEETDGPNNDDRARRAAHALRAYRDCTGDGPVSPDENVVDLLTDLRHFCDRYNVNLGRCDRVAHTAYLAEYDEENGGGR